MIDTLLRYRTKAAQLTGVRPTDLADGDYALATISQAGQRRPFRGPRQSRRDPERYRRTDPGRVPSLTLRPCTERPATEELGTNRVVNLDRALIHELVARTLRGERDENSAPESWDGHAAERIAGQRTRRGAADREEQPVF